MNKAIQWMKGNVLIVVSAVLALAAFGFVVLVTFVLRPGVIKSVETKVASQVKRTDDLLKQGKVRLPGKEPGSPMIERKGIVATPALIDSVRTIFDEFSKTGKEMRDFSRKVNGEAHENTCVVPDGGAVNAFNFEKIKKNYGNGFTAALWNPKLPAAGAMALTEEDRQKAAIAPLFAGPSLTQKELQSVSDEEVKSYIKSLGYEKFSELSAKQRENAEAKARNKVYDAIKARAQVVNLYAETDPSQPAWPFSRMVREWKENISPEAAYESQADLWVLRDMVDALRAANHSGEWTVVQAPVKRLLRLEVQREGYVGLHTMGMVVSGGASAGSGSGASFQAPPFQLPAENMPQVENFFASPTGRISNADYDVKHVKLEVIADMRRLPELLDAIGRVNAMTVVAVGLEDVDEYKELRENVCYYGPGDMVKATLVVETLWMRSWTTPKMPAETRKYLGISAAPTP